MYCENCDREYDYATAVCPVCNRQLISREDNENAFQDFLKLKDEETTEVDANSYQRHDNIMAAASYLNVLILIPLFSGRYKKSAFVKFHVHQGVRLFLLIICTNILLNYGTSLTMSFTQNAMVHIVSNGLSGIVGLLTTVLIIIGIINAIRFKTSPLPIIGKLFRKKTA